GARAVHDRGAHLRLRRQRARDPAAHSREGGRAARDSLPRLRRRARRPRVGVLADGPDPARDGDRPRRLRLRPHPAPVPQGLNDRVVVEVGRRGKLVVGEPYFTPGVPLVLDHKGLGDVAPGDLAVVRRGRGRARVEGGFGSAKRIENVLEALLVERGARVEFEPHSVPTPSAEGRVDLRGLPTYTIDPDTAKDFDD